MGVSNYRFFDNLSSLVLGCEAKFNIYALVGALEREKEMIKRL